MKHLDSRPTRAPSVAFVLLSALTAVAASQDRMPSIPAVELTQAQRNAIEELRRVRGIELRGPWVPLLRSPEVLSRARAMGDYLRYDSALAPHLREMLILLTASEWRQQYEWHAHYSIALDAGLSSATASAIAEGRRPTRLSPDETVLYDLFVELHHHHSVSDATYAAALELLGEQGIIDAVSIIGYYTLLAMIMNTAQTALPAGSAEMLPALP